ncbi:MAG: laccase domain-containing protein, partial [Acidobacteriota bacterium]
MSLSTSSGSSFTTSLWRIDLATAVRPQEARELIQVHGATIIQTPLDTKKEEADGALLTADSAPFAIRTADCMPLVMMTDQKALALHVSRKSLVAGLLDAVPDVIEPTQLTHIFIGPHIC